MDAKQGLYTSAYEHDACGVGMVVNIHGGKSHELVDNALRVLKTTSSHEEGCTRRWNIKTLEFIGKNGRLCGVRVQPIDWQPNPEGGRPTMVEAGDPEVIKCEACFLAMGFLKPQHPDYPENVFVCGDALNGASLVVRAMASGRDAAQKVDSYLQSL